MAVTVVDNYPAGKVITGAVRRSQAAGGVTADATNGAQARHVFFDVKGVVGEFGRGSGGLTTYIKLTNSEGNFVFISPHATDETGALVIAATAPV